MVSTTPSRVMMPHAAATTLLAYSGLCGQGEFEVGEVAGAGAVQGMAVPPGIQPDQVERDGAVHVFKVGLGQAAVAGATQAGDGDGLADGALDTGPQGVVGPPVLGGLLGAGLTEGVVEVAWVQGELASAALGGGALAADRARTAGDAGEFDHDLVGAVLGAWAPGGPA